jgi:hypothetical protein
VNERCRIDDVDWCWDGDPQQLLRALQLPLMAADTT